VRTLEVFAEVLCPFAYVGLRTVIDRRTAAGLAEPLLEVRSWPLELINGAPLDPGHIAAEITSLRASVRPDLFTGFAVASFPSTSMPAYAVMAAAQRSGDPALAERVALALRKAVFEDGLDIGRRQVAGHIADHFQLVPLDPEATSVAVHADWADGRARGVVGSPHFFADDSSWFCPALAISRDGHGDFVIAWKQDSEAFLDRVLAAQPGAEPSASPGGGAASGSSDTGGR